jgi:DNA end-binding protein Ku
MRPLWTGTIGFGLVSIPVKLYSGTQGSELDLDMLDAKDHERIRFKRVNEVTEKEVPWERIVKAFNLNGRYVVLEDKDLKNAAIEKTSVITIHDFVNEEEVEAKYYEKPYILEPDKGGSRPYALLREALKKSGRVAVGSFVMRTKEHPCVIQPDGPALLLDQLRFAEEVRSYDDLKLPKQEKISPEELKLAMQLIDQGAGEFRIERYKDEYTAALMKMIREKAKSKGKGKAVPEAPMRVVHKRTGEDLMEQLKASLGSRGTRSSSRSTRGTRAKRKAS